MRGRCCYVFLFASAVCSASAALGGEPPAQPRSGSSAQQNAPLVRQSAPRPNTILCHCEFVELSAQAEEEFYAALDLAAPRDAHNSAPAFVTYAAHGNAEKALRSLRESRRAKIQDWPPIAANIDRPAASMSGGEFPLLVPSTNGRVDVKWRWFGYRYEIVPHWLDTGRLQLKATLEIAVKDNKHAVVHNGLTIPGLTTRRAHAQMEMNLGDTAVVNLWSHSYEEDDLSAPSDSKAATHAKEPITLFLVTPVAANPATH